MEGPNRTRPVAIPPLGRRSPLRLPVSWASLALAAILGWAPLGAQAQESPPVGAPAGATAPPAAGQQSPPAPAPAPKPDDATEELRREVESLKQQVSELQKRRGRHRPRPGSVKLQDRNEPKKSQPGNNEKSGSNKDAAPAAPAAPAMTPATQADPPVSPAPASPAPPVAPLPVPAVAALAAPPGAEEGLPQVPEEGPAPEGKEGSLPEGKTDLPAESGKEAPPDGEGGGFWGTSSPGNGFLVANTRYGTLNVSGYGLWRYLNQMPNSSTFVDHLGQVRPIVNPRNDLQWHRALVHFRGWLLNPRFVYQSSVWGLQSTEQMAMVGYVGWRFSDSLNLSGGINSLPGSVTLLNNHPYWLGTDRVMANEFLRPGFTGGVWVDGNLPHRMWYRAMVANTISQLGVGSIQLDRDLAFAAHLSWMPTTGEYGPKGGLGDFYEHKKVATRFGISYTHSREDRFSQPTDNSPENVQIRNSDSVLFFETGSLAPGVTVNKANYNLLAMDAGMKHRGFSFDTELYHRWLNKFNADGPLPLNEVRDSGYFIQTSKMVKRRLVMLYGFHSFVLGQFNNAWEVGGGVNYFPVRQRNVRVNFQGMHVDRCPTSSQFGYYIGGMTGPILSLAGDVLF